MALLTRVCARARCEVAVDPSLVKSLGSSPASRLMAWSLDNADLRDFSGEVVNTGQSSSRHNSRSTRGPARHHGGFSLELCRSQPEATFTHRDEELFRLRNCQVSHAQDGLVSLTNHSVHFTGNVAWDTHASHVPIRVRPSCVSE